MYHRVSTIGGGNFHNISVIAITIARCPKTWGGIEAQHAAVVINIECSPICSTTQAEDEGIIIVICRSGDVTCGNGVFCYADSDATGKDRCIVIEIDYCNRKGSSSTAVGAIISYDCDVVDIIGTTVLWGFEIRCSDEAQVIACHGKQRAVYTTECVGEDGAVRIGDCDSSDCRGVFRNARGEITVGDHRSRVVGVGHGNSEGRSGTVVGTVVGSHTNLVNIVTTAVLRGLEVGRSDKAQTIS